MLGDVAFQKFKKIWSQSKIPLHKKLMVYEAQVVSVIMYNSSIAGLYQKLTGISWMSVIVTIYETS